VFSELADGTGGISPMLVSSGVAGLGTNIVLRTSRRPRNVPERLGGAACCELLATDAHAPTKDLLLAKYWPYRPRLH
jgi:hypothetical protein